MSGIGRGRASLQPRATVPLEPESEAQSGQHQPVAHAASIQDVPPVASMVEGIGRVSLGRGRGIRPTGTVPGLSPQMGETSDPGRAASMMPGSMLGTMPAPPDSLQQIVGSEPLPAAGRGRGGRGRPVVAEEGPAPGQPSEAVTTAPSSVVTASIVASTAAGSGSGTTGSTSAGGSSQPQAGPSAAAPVAEGGAVAERPPVVAPPADEQEVGEVKSYRGDKGDKVKVMSNFIRIIVAEDYALYEYNTRFNPHFEDTRVRKRVMATLSQDIGCKAWSFDGAKLFLPIKLEESKRSFTTTDPHDPAKPVTVTLTLVKISDKALVQHYNVLMRKIMTALNYTEINRDYYNPSKVTDMPTYNLEVWSGYTTAIEVYEGGLMLCLNSTCRVMRKDTVLDQMTQLKQRNPAGYVAAFQDLVGKKAVITRYNNKHYKLSDVDWNQNPGSTFERRGVPITFTEYYLTQYGVEIQDKTQPVLMSQIKRKKNDPRGEFYYVSLIPELCHQSGLTDEMRGNFNLMRDLIALSRTSPMQRHAAIKDFLDSINVCEKAQDIMKSWGLSFAPECLIDMARLIPGPTIQFSTFTMKVAPPDFTREATSNKCFNPVSLNKWQIYCTGQDRDKADKMIQQYKQVSPPLGIIFGPQPDIIVLANRSGRGMPTALDIRQALRTNVTIEKQIQFIVVILPMAKDDLYAAVKRFCLGERSTPSQVILSKTLANDKKLRAVMQKVVLQINCKLGGSLWALNIPLKDLIMFVGVDVHHEPGVNKKSVLALVASLDNYCTKYYSRIVHQGPQQETQDSIRPVFIQALEAFYTENQRYPDRIVVFRDGVGDGQLEHVQTKEVIEFRKAVETICKDKPKLLFVVVQKRINERLFLIKPARQLENPHPGTVMDHTITRRGLYDFFLVSQLVRQGTVGPSHFIVLFDSDENKPDLIQRFAYVTSFMYFNWPGTVRVPAMCQYAHKLAMLVGQHLESEPLNTMERQLYYL